MKKRNRSYDHLSIVYPNYRRPYPNAADPQYFVDRLVDGMLSVATIMGTLTIVIFLITL
jgi:hypothetical protein